MSFIQSEFSEYTLSHDELMLKELERRDGIYSFIFHELETPKDVLSLEDSIELQKHFVKKQKHLLRVEAASEGGNADEIEEKIKVQQNTCNIETDTLVLKTNKTTATSSASSLSLSSSSSSSSLSSPPAAALEAALPLTSSSLINSKIITTTRTQAKLCETNISSGNSLTFKKSTCEYLKTWHPPPSSCLSLPMPLPLSLISQQSTATHLPFTMYDHSKLYNFVATGGFRVRIPTPRFSHVSAPLIRNRRHALKETSAYKNFEKSIDRVPDLRELFPLDPDVHAPFAEMSDINEPNEEEDNHHHATTHIIL